MKQFQILYKDDKGFLENLNEIKRWRNSHPAYVTIFRIYSEDMDDDIVLVFSKGSGFLEHGIIFLMLGGEDFHTYSTFISGWKPLKRKFRVTKADREIFFNSVAPATG